MEFKKIVELSPCYTKRGIKFSFKLRTFQKRLNQLHPYATKIMPHLYKLTTTEKLIFKQGEIIIQVPSSGIANFKDVLYDYMHSKHESKPLMEYLSFYTDLLAKLKDPSRYKRMCLEVEDEDFNE